MTSPAFLSGQTTCTVWPTASIACSNTKISYSSVNSPVSMRIFLPGMGGSFQGHRKRGGDAPRGNGNGNSERRRREIELPGVLLRDQGRVELERAAHRRLAHEVRHGH